MLNEADILERGWELITNIDEVDNNLFWKGSRIYHKNGFLLQTAVSRMNYYIMHNGENLFTGFFIDGEDFDKICEKYNIK